MVKSYKCPVCGSIDCEVAISHRNKKDLEIPKGAKKSCYLCYTCGASDVIILRPGM